MAFESFTSTLLSRVAETHDPGSADAYLRLTNASEASLKLIGWSVISEAIYRYGSEPAKKIVADVLVNKNPTWDVIFDVAGRLPEESVLARRLAAAPEALDVVLDRWTRLDDLLSTELGVQSAGVTKRKALRWRHALRFLPVVRNKVKGHGAPPSRIYQHLNPLLHDLVQAFVTELVAPIPPALAFLRPTRDGHGLFLNLGSPVREVELPIGVPTLQAGDVVLQVEGGQAAQLPLVPLVTFDEKSRALLVYNDSVAEQTGEVEYLDFLQGQVSRKPNAFVTRHGFAELPLSETTATAVLRTEPGVVVPHNLPERRRGHVPRRQLEDELEKVACDDKHRILSLDGRGGVGKTYLATEVCHRIVRNAAARDRFGFVLWMSARDIDLTGAGPRPVKQDLVTVEDVLRFVVRAYDPEAAGKLEGEALKNAFVESCKVLHPLLILDNFETFEHPEVLLRLIDEIVPNPAKVLITSRHRYFRGDFPIPVGAMSEQESKELILAEAGARFVRAHFESSDRVRRVYEVAQGHAYTMRLIVGNVAKGESVHDACTAIEKKPDLLAALFERTFRLVEPADAELAAVLAAYRGECPLEALLLLPLPRRDVENAIDRLFELSLLERSEPLLHLPQYSCPRSAGEYIRRKGLLESPERRARVEGVAASLRASTQIIKLMIRRIPGGVRTTVQAADAMLDVARIALDRKEPGMARRAIDVALDLAGEDGRILSEAAELSRRAGSGDQQVESIYERALAVDPLNAQSWLQWGIHKARSNAPPGQAMSCFERATEADPDLREAVEEFAGSVLEVVRQEKRLGFGAVRLNSDRRPARALLTKAETALDSHLTRKNTPSERARLLALKGWAVLQLRGVGPEVWQIAREAEKLAPSSAQSRSLIESLKRMESERPSKRPGAGDE